MGYELEAFGPKFTKNQYSTDNEAIPKRTFFVGILSCLVQINDKPSQKLSDRKFSGIHVL